MTALWLVLTGSALADDILRIAVEDHYPPFSYADSLDRPAGFNVDVGRELARVLGMTARITAKAWDDLLPGLGRDEYDIIVACMASTPEREAVADFTDCYFRSITGFVGRVSLGHDISPEALAGLVLCSQQGTAQLAYLEKNYGKVCTIRATPTMNQGFDDLLAGRTDLVLTPLLAAFEFLNNQKTDAFDMVGPALSKSQFAHAPACIAVRKGETELVEKLNQAIRQIRVDGSFAAICLKYFPFRLY